MPNKFDCISIGAATVDVILKSDSFKVLKNPNFETGLAICEMYGSKTEIKDFYVGSGGGATNSSCSLSNLGLNTSCISAIGDDNFSDQIIDDLKRFNVDYSNIIIKKNEKSAFSTILTTAEGGRTVLVYRGVCSKITFNDIKDKEIDTDWVYLTNLGDDFINALSFVEVLTRKGISIFWNPGSNELKNTDEKLFSLVSVLSINSEEAAVLSGISMHDTTKLIKYLFDKVSATGIILLTLGAKGAFYITKKRILHISSFKTTVENTVGAGDAFGSGFLYGLIRKKSIEECLEYAIKNSVCVIQKTGAKEGFLRDLKLLPKPLYKDIKIS